MNFSYHRKVLEYVYNSYLKLLYCASAMVHFFRPTVVGLLGFSGDMSWLLLTVCLY